MFQLEGECYSIVKLEISWEKETCIHMEHKAALEGSLSFTLNAPLLLCQRLDSGLELFPSGFHD